MRGKADGPPRRCEACGQAHDVGIEGIRCDYDHGIERLTLGMTRAWQENILEAYDELAARE